MNDRGTTLELKPEVETEMAVIEITEKRDPGMGGEKWGVGWLDTESLESRQTTEAMIRDKRLAHFIVRAIDETGGGRPVGTIDDVRETDRELRFDRPPML